MQTAAAVIACSSCGTYGRLYTTEQEQEPSVKAVEKKQEAPLAETACALFKHGNNGFVPTAAAAEEAAAPAAEAPAPVEVEAYLIRTLRGVLQQ